MTAKQPAGDVTRGPRVTPAFRKALAAFLLGGVLVGLGLGSGDLYIVLSSVAFLALVVLFGVVVTSVWVEEWRQLVERGQPRGVRSVGKGSRPGLMGLGVRKES